MESNILGITICCFITLHEFSQTLFLEDNIPFESAPFLYIKVQIFSLCRNDEKITRYVTVVKLHEFPILSADTALGIFLSFVESSPCLLDQT